MSNNQPRLNPDPSGENIVNVGSDPNAGNGDPIRNAFEKVNSSLLILDSQKANLENVEFSGDVLVPLSISDETSGLDKRAVSVTDLRFELKNNPTLDDPTLEGDVTTPSVLTGADSARGSVLSQSDIDFLLSQKASLDGDEGTGADFTVTPTINGTNIATVDDLSTDLQDFAPLNSPNFTGQPSFNGDDLVTISDVTDYLNNNSVEINDPLFINGARIKVDDNNNSPVLSLEKLKENVDKDIGGTVRFYKENVLVVQDEDAQTLSFSPVLTKFSFPTWLETNSFGQLNVNGHLKTNSGYDISVNYGDHVYSTPINTDNSSQVAKVLTDFDFGYKFHSYLENDAGLKNIVYAKLTDVIARDGHTIADGTPTTYSSVVTANELSHYLAAYGFTLFTPNTVDAPPAGQQLIDFNNILGASGEVTIQDLTVSGDIRFDNDLLPSGELNYPNIGAPTWSFGDCYFQKTFTKEIVPFPDDPFDVNAAQTRGEIGSRDRADAWGNAYCEFINSNLLLSFPWDQTEYTPNFNNFYTCVSPSRVNPASAGFPNYMENNMSFIVANIQDDPQKPNGSDTLASFNFVGYNALQLQSAALDKDPFSTGQVYSDEVVLYSEQSDHDTSITKIGTSEYPWHEGHFRIVNTFGSNVKDQNTNTVLDQALYSPIDLNGSSNQEYRNRFMVDDNDNIDKVSISFYGLSEQQGTYIPVELVPGVPGLVSPDSQTSLGNSAYPWPKGYFEELNVDSLNIAGSIDSVRSNSYFLNHPSFGHYSSTGFTDYFSSDENTFKITQFFGSDEGNLTTVEWRIIAVNGINEDSVLNNTTDKVQFYILPDNGSDVESTLKSIYSIGSPNNKWDNGNFENINAENINIFYPQSPSSTNNFKTSPFLNCRLDIQNAGGTVIDGKSAINEFTVRFEIQDIVKESFNDGISDDTITFTFGGASTEVPEDSSIGNLPNDGMVYGVRLRPRWSNKENFIGTSGVKWTDGYFVDLHVDNGVTTSSDLRAKYNIKPLDNTSINSILNLNPVSFTFKQTERDSLGLIAQEVEEHFPEAVQYNETADTYYLNYNNLIAPLVKTVQSLQKQVNQLSQQLAELKNGNT